MPLTFRLCVIWTRRGLLRRIKFKMNAQRYRSVKIIYEQIVTLYPAVFLLLPPAPQHQHTWLQRFYLELGRIWNSTGRLWDFKFKFRWDFKSSRCNRGKCCSEISIMQMCDSQVKVSATFSVGKYLASIPNNPPPTPEFLFSNGQSPFAAIILSRI